MAFKTVDEAFVSLEQFILGSEKGFGTECKMSRMETLLELLGRPDKAFKAIHVAGSKGKGSTSAYIASMLKATGIKTGLYTSPHIFSYAERITNPYSFFPPELYIEWIDQIIQIIQKTPVGLLGGKPTLFEVITLLAFTIFRESGCEWAVIEVGIGGRNDVTNLIMPKLSVITPIELEHTAILGDTLEMVASEKAGIIKREIPVVSSLQQKEAEAVLRSKAERESAPFVYLPEKVTGLKSKVSRSGTEFTFKTADGEAITGQTRMLGKVQAENCALAYTALTSCPDLNLSRNRALISGVKEFLLPARMEVVKQSPFTLVDGAHTINSIAHTLKTFLSLAEEEAKKVLIIGVLEGKSYSLFADQLVPHFDYIIVSKPGGPKKSSPEKVYEIFKEKKRDVELIYDPQEALERANSYTDREDAILVTGSFYIASEILKVVERDSAATES